VSAASEPEPVKNTRFSPSGMKLDDAVGQLERQRVAELEGRRVVQLRRLAAHRLGNLGAAMAQAAAPQAREAVEDLAPVGVTVAGHQPGVRLEVAVAGEGHPVRGQPVGVRARGGGVQALCIGHVHGGLVIGGCGSKPCPASAAGCEGALLTAALLPWILIYPCSVDNLCK
jgi:hypothetical protein